MKFTSSINRFGSSRTVFKRPRVKVKKFNKSKPSEFIVRKSVPAESIHVGLITSLAWCRRLCAEHYLASPTTSIAVVNSLRQLSASQSGRCAGTILSRWNWRRPLALWTSMLCICIVQKGFGAFAKRIKDPVYASHIVRRFILTKFPRD